MRFEWKAKTEGPGLTDSLRQELLRVARASVIRSGDLVFARGDSDIAILTTHATVDSETVLRRWTERAGQSFGFLASDLQWRGGWALYPADGFTARELLRKAEERVENAGGVRQGVARIEPRSSDKEKRT